jgi:putative transposase
MIALKQVALGAQVAEVCRKIGIREPSYYRWKNKYGGMLPSDVQRLRQLAE